MVSSGMMPAFAHTTSRPPYRSTAVAMSACMSASELTSPAKADASPPAATSSAAVASASSRWRELMITLAPASAKTIAIPLPMPREDPVTTTVRPAAVNVWPAGRTRSAGRSLAKRSLTASIPGRGAEVGRKAKSRETAATAARRSSRRVGGAEAVESAGATIILWL